MEMNGKELRKTIRLKTLEHFARSFSLPESDVVLPEKAKINDISEGGAAIEFHWPPEKGDFPVSAGDSLEFSLQFEFSVLNIASIVRRIESNPEKARIRLGVEFTQLSDSEKQKVQKMMVRLASSKLRSAGRG